MLSKRAWVLLVCIILLLLTGCVDVDIEITINKNGSGEVMYRIAMDPLLSMFLKESDSDPFADLIKEAEDGGFLVTTFSNEKTGMEARKVIENMGENSGFNLFDDEFNMDQIVMEKGLFKNHIILDTELDLTVLGNDSIGEFERFFGQIMPSTMRFDFTLNLPIKPTRHNASITENEGKTLIWNLIPGGTNSIYMEAEVLNIQNIGILAGLCILLIVVTIILLIKRKGSN